MKGEKIREVITIVDRIFESREDRSILAKAKKELDQLIAENAELDSRNMSLELANASLLTKLEERKRYAEIGRIWEWYYTECRETFGVSGGRLTKRQRYQMLLDAISDAYRNK